MHLRRLLLKAYKWRIRYVKERQFIMFLSFFTGLLAGLGAVIIKNLVHLIKHSLESLHNYSGSFYISLLLPLAGLVLVMVFIKYLLRKKVDHGIPTVLYSISKRNGKIPPHNIFSSVIASSLTVGFGGSVGLEGPTLATGAAIGSNLGRLFGLNYRQVVLMLGCASAGAMAAIFKAPIAAVVFALEVIMINLTMATIIPLLIASVTGAITSYLFLGQDTLYVISDIESYNLSELPYFALLGVFTGLVSLYFIRTYIWVAGLFEKIKKWQWRLLIGAVLLGGLILVFPSLYGEGYESTNTALHGSVDHLFSNNFFSGMDKNIFQVLTLLLMIVGLKVIATSLTFGAGGVGGVFAPALFVGANAGLFFGKLLDYLGIELNEQNFSLVAMGGLLSGVIHAPLTGIFLIAEITGGYELLLPLMITATLSYATIRLFQPSSVYTYQLAKRGELFTHHQDRTALSLMEVRDLIETKFNPIGPDETLGELVKLISKSERNIFPVLDAEGIFLGMVWLNDIRDIVFKPGMYDTTYVRDLMFMPTPVVSPTDSMEEVASKFHGSSHYNLAVLDEGKYLGFVSRANVFSKYRELIKDMSED